MARAGEVVVTDSAEAKAAAESMPRPMAYQAGRADRRGCSDEGTDEAIVLDFRMPRGPARPEAYRALKEAFAPLA